MGLQSQQFKGDPALEACLVRDSAHVVPGAVGGHVKKIQAAVQELDSLSIDPGDLVAGRYGPSTAAAVLAFKKRRNIINYSYQTQADNVVGKMTIAALDRELVQKDAAGATTCRLTSPCPCDVPSRKGRRLSLSPTLATDEDLMRRAFQDSRASLRRAVADLTELNRALVARHHGRGELTPKNRRVFNSAIKWLSLKTRADQGAAVAHVQAAILLMKRNLAVKTSAGADPALRRAGFAHFGQSDLNQPDKGVRFGDEFFAADTGPHCRRDVLTHEYFHFLGVKHGGTPLNEGTNRALVTTPALALDSADNLAQLVAEIATVGGKTDACAFAGE